MPCVSDGRQHDPHVVDGCGAGGQLGASRHADGAGPGGLQAVAGLPAVRPGVAGVGQSGSVRAFGRARVGAVVLDAASGRGEVGQPGLRDRRRAGGLAGGPAPVPAAGLQVPRPPRVPLDLGRGVHHRPAGHRDRHQRRDGHRRTVAGRHLQPARLRTVRLRRLRAVRRRLPDGGHRRRGRLAGRAPEAVQPVLDLRQQQDHHRGRHQPGVLRGRAGPVRRLRLGGAARRRRQRPGRAGCGLRRVSGRDRASDADRGGQHHRLRLAEQGGHARRAR